MVEENKRQKLPANWHKKQEWAKRKLANMEEKEAIQEANLDYNVEKLRDVQADEADRWEKRRAAKSNPDTGFTSFEDSTARKYERMSRQIKPDLNEYKRMKEELPEEHFFPTKDSYIVDAKKNKKEDIDRLLGVMDAEYSRQKKFSRRRTFNDDADIDYINDRNMAFNKKIDRFYGKYTAEIKQNLERGTAIWSFQPHPIVLFGLAS